MTSALNRVVLSVLLCCLAALGLAQAPLSEDAERALSQAQTLASQALATYPTHYVDRPLWQEAIRFGQQAQRLAPDSTEPYRFLGQVYAQVRLYEQAWQAWRRFEATGGQLDADARQTLVRLGSDLGYTKYSSGLYQEAIPYYERVVEIAPDLEAPKAQLAQSYLQVGRDLDARALFEQLAREYPDNSEYRRQLAVGEDAARYGQRAADAFNRGLALYYSGQIDQAWLAFGEAARASPDYRDAFVWAGRVALELRQPQDAAVYWQRAAELDPSDQTAAYFARVARNQAQWGIEAFTVFEEGVNLHAAGELPQAEARFERAAQLNPAYAEAWGWLGRSRFEQSDFAGAVAAYERANALAPEIEAYRYFYQESARQAGVTAQVAPAPEDPQTEAPAPEPDPLTALPAPQPVPQPAPAPGPTPQPAPQPQLVPAPEPVPQPEPAPEPEPAPALPESQPTPEPAPEPEPAPTPSPEPAPTPTPPPAPPQPAPAPVQAAATGGPALTLLQLERTFQDAGSAVSFLDSASSLLRDLHAPVDYAGGTLHHRLEALSTPSGAPVAVQLCLVPNDDITIRPACTDSSLFSSGGSAEAQQRVPGMTNADAINWNRGVSNIMLLLKDENGVVLDRQSGKDLSAYYPLTIRYSAVLVPAGGSFPGW